MVYVRDTSVLSHCAGRVPHVSQYFFERVDSLERYSCRFFKMMGGASAGDWNCPNCEAMVFASKNACYKCHTPKPQGAGGYDQGSFFSFGVGSPVLQTTLCYMLVEARSR